MLKTIDHKLIPYLPSTHTSITAKYWKPIEENIRLIVKYFGLTTASPTTPTPAPIILDVGGVLGQGQFKYATHTIDVIENKAIPNVIKADLDFETIPFANGEVNFVYCRHTLEDIQNPQHAFKEITRIANQGYIETPSPLVELSNNVDDALEDLAGNKLHYKGYAHHRYIVWSNKDTNTLYFLPKYPIIDTLNDLGVAPHRNKYNYLLNNYPLYWNNYYIWDKNHLPKIVVYRHGSNFEIKNEYSELLYRAVKESIEYTNYYINTIQHI